MEQVPRNKPEAWLHFLIVGTGTDCVPPRRNEGVELIWKLQKRELFLVWKKGGNQAGNWNGKSGSTPHENFAVDIGTISTRYRVLTNFDAYYQNDAKLMSNVLNLPLGSENDSDVDYNGIVAISGKCFYILSFTRCGTNTFSFFCLVN